MTSKKPNPINELQNSAEAQRLEGLWAGSFGHDYIGRNSTPSEGRAAFWKDFLHELNIQSALEVGCNIGLNLEWIVQEIGASNVTGIDINEEALGVLKQRIPGIHAIHTPARNLPFKDASFDLTFTSGVLIHQPETSLTKVMNEVVRVSRRYVLCMEYYSNTIIEKQYRGQEGALFKRNYGQLYQNQFPKLRLISQGFLGKDAGWDDITYWTFKKQ